MSGRRESVGRLSARTQSASAEPTQQMVSVAVLPPRLNSGVAPPTGIGASGAISWDESINWRHNEKIDADKNVSKRKQAFRKAGLTTQRKTANPDLPPFTLRQVPYDTWRKHYAKDKDGNYKGTHAPAEDCLLKSDDVQKWRLGDPVTKADLWTRGTEALPVYAEVKGTAALPEYRDPDYDEPPTTPHPGLATGEDFLDPEDDRLVSHVERQDSTHSSRSKSNASLGSDLGSVPPRQHSYSMSQTRSIPEEPEQSGKIIADGKTAQEIIAEAKAKGEKKPTWKQMVGNGVRFATYGA